MPDAHPGALAHRDAVQPLGHREQAGQHLRKREIRPQRLLRHLEAALLQPLAEEREVPGLELAPGKLLEIRELPARGRPAAPRQVVQKPQHLLAALRHAGRQRIVGEALEAQQLGELVAQRQYLGDDRVVVEAARAGAELGGARDPGLVDVAPQLRALGAGHHRHIGGLIELEQPARLLRLARIRGGAIDRVRRQACELGVVGHAARDRRARRRARSPKTWSPVGRAAARCRGSAPCGRRANRRRPDGNRAARFPPPCAAPNRGRRLPFAARERSLHTARSSGQARTSRPSAAACIRCRPRALRRNWRRHSNEPIGLQTRLNR